MRLNPIAIAIPLFFAAIGIELWVARRRGVQAFRYTDAITNLSCGLGSQGVGLVLTALLLSIYTTVFQRWTVVRFPENSPWPWVIGFFGIDFLYYWWHRFSHEVNFLWGVHAVHHQSEDYNLAVALRQPYFSALTLFAFYLPLALLGVPPLIYATHAALSLLYQFWIHTELIDRLPRPLEWVLNTPSHHRVHHGINLEYLDKNYGAILIVWDRLFGTFQPEGTAVVYGVTKPINSFNPLWANVEYFETMRGVAARAPGFWTKLRVIFAPPGWNPATGKVELPGAVVRGEFVKYRPVEVARGTQIWIAAQLGVLSFALMGVLLYVETIPQWVLAICGGLILLATLAWSGILEGKRWSWPLEIARIGASVAFTAWFVQAGNLLH